MKSKLYFTTVFCDFVTYFTLTGIHLILFISYSTLENDIALIRLNKLVDTIFENYNLPIMPACLPLKENGITYEAKDFVVQGWGRTAPNFIDVCKDGECLIKRISGESPSSNF